MTRNTRIAVIATAAILLVAAILIAAVLTSRPAPPDADPASPPPAAMRSDTHVLDPGPDDVVLVEFLDFECEACGAFFPYVEQLRSEYAGRVTFAFRYFPLPSHGNSLNAAVAVEAAARQDALQPMFRRMFETQAAWGERGGESQAHVFRGYAEELGLDLERYDADIADPEVMARVQADFDDGIRLGVDRTPTFFLNDEKLDAASPSDLVDALDAVLAR